MNTMKNIFKKDYLYLGILTILLIAGAFIVFSITVKGLERNDSEALNEYFKVLEDEYVSSARAYLNEEGYVNSGVMLNHTTDENGMRTYTLSVHNSRFEYASEDKMNEIKATLESLSFTDPGCTTGIKII
ncbi:MAG: hypothetical protein J6X94_05265 [Lachnospiraceae bacterium]|nr:hypothetical protein [Lachnospiraceae bacterium]